MWPQKMGVCMNRYYSTVLVGVVRGGGRGSRQNVGGKRLGVGPNRKSYAVNV